MSYFSRLTDIVTCNLGELLAEAADPAATLEEIIQEMRAGVDAAQRSVKTAAATEERIREEIEDLGNQLKYWSDVARQELRNGREDKARLALMRKGEVEDLIAGIKQQHTSADATLKHLTTTLHALEARLSDAIRRRASTGEGAETSTQAGAEDADSTMVAPPTSLQEERERQIEKELAAMKRELDS